MTLLSWLNLEFWGPVWPNLAASAVVGTAAWLWARRSFLAELDRRDAVHAERHAKTHQLLRELHERLPAPESPKEET